MVKRVLPVPSAPGALGPYSGAVQAAGLVFLSGQVALKPGGGREDGDTAAQTRQVMDNIGAMLGDNGLGYADIVKTTIFLSDMAHYQGMNAVFNQYFQEDPPARSTVQAGLALPSLMVEIEAMALVDDE